MKTMLKTVLSIDKKSIVICVTYNLIKQLMNVFYGVYFVRLILVGLEVKQSIWYILGILLLMFVVNFLFSKLNQYYQNIYIPIFKLKLDSCVNEQIIQKFNSIPYDIANSSKELDKYNRLIEYSSKMILQSYQAFGLICGLIEAFAMILYYIISVDAFAIILAVFPLLYSYFLGEKSEKLKYELHKKMAVFDRKKEYAKRVYYVRDYVKEIRTSQIGRIVKAIYQDGYIRTVKAYREDGKKIAVTSFWELFLGDALSMILPIAYVVVRMLNGAKYLLGDFIGVTQAITVFSSDVEWMLDTIIELKASSLYIHDYREYITRKEDSNKLQHKIGNLDKFVITFDHVSYQYENDYALKDVSLEIHSGEKIAIVGRNGAGKTTFISLLINLISCSSGRVLLNGINLEDYDKEDLKSFFGIIFQDYHIYPISIRNNISVNGPIADNDIWNSIRKVGLSNRINSIDTVLGKEIDDSGVELSGGEQQRLALTRVIANEFPVVILDESTSALDAITERNVNQLILDALKDSNRTLIFISHKLSTTKLVDRILVFEEGKVIEQGSHLELLEQGGLYAEMYREQNNMYKGQNI